MRHLKLLLRSVITAYLLPCRFFVIHSIVEGFVGRTSLKHLGSNPHGNCSCLMSLWTSRLGSWTISGFMVLDNGLFLISLSIIWSIYSISLLNGILLYLYHPVLCHKDLVGAGLRKSKESHFNRLSSHIASNKNVMRRRIYCFVNIVASRRFLCGLLHHRQYQGILIPEVEDLRMAYWHLCVYAGLAESMALRCGFICLERKTSNFADWHIIIDDIITDQFFEYCSKVFYSPRSSNKVAHEIAKYSLNRRISDSWAEDVPQRASASVIADLPLV
ncbi:hypothetical protein POM88_018205 [Heracleum sosnowskyi]|uniref:Uncharacterized protein n=1 Tax=Heracleum sosnowskyi TaxID=360622 RepID=A0AAD8IT94_9APIA|nr:hypothetical protein POM88_018205 [Heracleum sosnowskyi]